MTCLRSCSAHIQPRMPGSRGHTRLLLKEGIPGAGKAPGPEFGLDLSEAEGAPPCQGLNAGPSHGDVVLTGEGTRGQRFPQRRETRPVAMLRGEALKGEAQVWGRSPQPHPSPLLSARSGAWTDGCTALLPEASERPAWCPPARVRAHVPAAGGEKGLCVCAFAGDAAPHPPSCCCSRREQDALTLSCTFGAGKPQPRQQRVHRAGWEAAPEAGCAGVCQHARAGPAWGVVPTPATPRGGGQGG